MVELKERFDENEKHKERESKTDNYMDMYKHNHECKCKFELFDYTMNNVQCIMYNVERRMVNGE
jgi:hypothetical protein